MRQRVLGVLLGFSLALSTLPARADEVVVFAAASLTNALNEIGQAFTARTGHVIKPSYAASSALAKQVEQGSPAHIFASADLKWMDYLADKKLIKADSRFNLLGNTLVLIAPADSKLDRQDITPKTDLADLAGTGRIATGNPDSVPVGIYFRQAMERSGQWGRIQGKLAGTDSVRAALAFVERGEVSLGVVYATDAAISKKVKLLGSFPDSMHDPIVYPFALIDGKAPAAAKDFLDFLKSPEALGVFARHGFKIT